MSYRVEKYNWNTGAKVADYGGECTEKDVKDLIKGCKRNYELTNEYQAVYERKNTVYLIFVSKGCDFFAPENINKKAFWER